MHEIDFAIFRKNLKILRRAYDLSAKELSEKSGMKQIKRISDLEDGRGSPSIEEIYSICHVLGISIDKIMFHELRITIQ